MIKKIISILILILFVTTNSCYAYSKLYYLKSVDVNQIEPLIEQELSKKKYKIIKSNPYYAVSKDGDDKVIMILQQSGENLFYYYQSEDVRSVNRRIIKAIKKSDIVSEESVNANIISIYDDLAKKIATDNMNNYKFEETVEKTYHSETQLPSKENSFNGYVAQIPSGTEIPVYLQSSINTSTASYGDSVIAIVSSDVSLNGNVIFPQGSVVYGSLTHARHATYGSRNGKVCINFEKIVTPENKSYNIYAEEIDFTVSNDGKVASSARSFAKAAAIGAIAGVLFAAMSDRSLGSAAAIGAGVGAGSSLLYSTAERGVDAEIPSFTELSLSLKRPVKILISNFR